MTILKTMTTAVIVYLLVSLGFYREAAAAKECKNANVFGVEVDYPIRYILKGHAKWNGRNKPCPYAEILTPNAIAPIMRIKCSIGGKWRWIGAPQRSSAAGWLWFEGKKRGDLCIGENQDYWYFDYPRDTSAYRTRRVKWNSDTGYWFIALDVQAPNDNKIKPLKIHLRQVKP